ncbi:T9SS C-terminal target domain-containing protein [Pontibacter diazotrophicus]|uniref:T9SS C-terminal target domain-containing protein n=2 Tax=Pontibacter diazotrophicus TaxID=1400979 RepID=A0A3D8LFJ4_9BACT|nr:T9SS C-terminal target domain-containing protein [Pontibacter diazotrophicus]
MVRMDKTFTILLGLLVASLFTSKVLAQKYEAENATLAGGASKIACAGCSGGSAVAQGEGNLTFTVTIPTEGFYNIYIKAAAPSGDKINKLEIGGNTLDFSLKQNNQYTTHKLVSAQKQAAGQHQVKISKSWGWIDIDYIEFESVDGTDRFDLNQTLVTPNPTKEATALYNFLLDNYGDKIISGVMTLNSFDESEWLKENTGKEPALLGIDFMHSGRDYDWYDDETPINDAKTWYSRNGIPALMWHWRDPSRTTEEFYTRTNTKPEGTTFDISRISDPTSAEYTAMLADIDYVAGMLKELQDQNVPVIWRPLHEAAGGWFWWGAKGPAPLKALWHLMYDRIVNHHGLRNLIWVWTREPDDDAWYPGDEYVDIVGRDIYKDGDHGSQTLEFSDMNSRYGGKKMLTLSEVGSFPDVDNLVSDGAAWSWYMPWYGGYTRDSKYNSLALWRKMFAHEYVITLDEMPQLSTYERQDPVTEPTGLWNSQKEKPAFVAYPTMVVRDLVISSERRMKTVTVYNAQGKLVKKQNIGGTTATVSFTDLAPGLYLVKTNLNGAAVRIIKK